MIQIKEGKHLMGEQDERNLVGLARMWFRKIKHAPTRVAGDTHSSMTRRGIGNGEGRNDTPVSGGLEVRHLLKHAESHRRNPPGSRRKKTQPTKTRREPVKKTQDAARAERTPSAGKLRKEPLKRDTQSPLRRAEKTERTPSGKTPSQSVKKEKTPVSGRAEKSRSPRERKDPIKKERSPVSTQEKDTVRKKFYCSHQKDTIGKKSHSSQEKGTIGKKSPCSHQKDTVD